jgi:peptidoglycan/xylan/chitin deacetylase (PgdA/CDA1 family)
MLRALKNRYRRMLAARRLPIRMDRAVVSVTFDDVPRSAYLNGLPVLDSLGIKGTFYVAMGLCGASVAGAAADMQDHEHLAHADIIDLYARGHDIACHTYSHYRLDQGTPEGLVDDAARNVAALQQLLGGAPVEHFSYPFGQLDFRLKRLLSSRYKTMRSSCPGINDSATDLNLLLATSIYSRSFDRSALAGIVDAAMQSGAWLVLYTHGVTENPGAHDCTAEQLAWVLEYCRSSGAELLPVSAAYAAVTARSGLA